MMKMKIKSGDSSLKPQLSDSRLIKIVGEGKVWETESAFLTYLRGCLRKAWEKHPNKLKKLKSSRVQVTNTNPNGRQPTVFGYICDCCGKELISKDAVVDHIIPAGSLTSLDDIQAFVERLLIVSEDDLRVICKLCNTTLAYADKHNMSFEDASIMKVIIEHEKHGDRVKNILYNNGITPESNKDKRREQIFKLFKERGIQ